MRRFVLLAPALAVFAGCSAPAQPAPSPSGQPSAPASAAAPALPPDPEPGETGTCPYLKTDFVADANGQKVSKVRLSADAPHPACFYYGLDGKLQLTARVYVGEPAVATALVNKAAPVDTSNPADEPSGWKGGYQPTGDGGAVYAVAKGNSAVIVTTNQKQSVKARTVTTKAIATLKL
ncbi:DUF2020 domain-containing protein [Amycolatopsis samaneae]|uniref:DUF2020 domain-containing protein n=1 Tax=Amycolatopsis samaneae TaxID=664691 RepID=A0ABW5GJY3_9PSEU